MLKLIGGTDVADDGALNRWPAWAEDPDGWDHDTDAPGIGLFGRAIQVWSAMQPTEPTVADAAAAFHVDPVRVAEAVINHPWMFLVDEDGDLVGGEGDDGTAQPLPGPGADYGRITICHEGE